MTRKARRGSWLLLGLAAVLAGFPAGFSGAQQGAARVEVTATQVEGTRLTVAVAVLDAASNPIGGLSIDAFTVTVDGAVVTPAAVTSGVDAALPLGIVLTVDTSGSMAGTAIASAKQAILPVVNALQAGDQAALLTFAQTVSLAVPLTGETGTLAAAIQGMAATGNTALFAGVTRAAELASAAPQPRRAVVLLSDGEDFGAASGGITRDQALESARAAGVPFFVVGLGQEVDQQFLTSLASTTGGQYFAAADPAQLGQLYARISDRLRQQYTINLPLPEGLAGGSHRLTVSAGGSTGVATFETQGPPPPQAQLSAIPPALMEETIVSLSGVPAGATVRFAIDGELTSPLADGRSVRLDPYAFEPGRTYTLSAAIEGGDTVEQTFTVAPLPPLLLAPREIPNLRPGDLVRLTIQSQPGDVTAVFLVDGAEVRRVTAPPYEFVLPDADYQTGDHELRVVVSSGAGSAEVGYQFAGPVEPGPNYAAYVLFAALGAVVLAAVFYGGRRAFGWYRARPEPLDTSGVSDQLAAWAELRRGGRDEAVPEEEPAARAEPWGALTVVSGPDAGKVFQLRDEVELVGRGKFCTVRLSDPGLQEAHFVISPDGRLNASTPQCRVEVDGEVVRSAVIVEGSRIRAGATEMVVSDVSVPGP